MEKPIRSESDAPAKAQEVLAKFEKCSRDHLLTYMDEDMCMTLAKAWPAIDTAINQALKDMAKPVPNAEAQVNMNAILIAGTQILSRIHEFAEKGGQLLTPDVTTTKV